MGAGTDAGNLFSGTADLIGTLFPGNVSSSGSGSSSTTSEGVTKSSTRGKQTEQLELDELAVQKIIQDVLSGSGGLAEIFGGEQVAGIFDSSVTAQASGDLAAKLVGELTKLTAKRSTDSSQSGTQRVTGSQDTTSAQAQHQDNEGIFEQIGGFFGF